MHRTITLAVAASLACLAACASNTTHTGPAAPALRTNATISDLTGEWTLTTINAAPTPPLAGGDARTVGFTIAHDGGLSGFAGVNRIAGTLDAAALPSGAFKTSPLVSTRMAGPEDRMKLESEFTQALSAAARYTLKGNTLALHPAEPEAPALLTLTRRR